MGEAEELPGGSVHGERANFGRLVLGGGGESESSSRTEDIGKRLRKEAGRDNNMQKKSREPGKTTDTISRWKKKMQEGHRPAHV